MTMHIEINSETEAALSRRAAAQGVEVDVYAAILLEQAAYRAEAVLPVAAKTAPRRSLREVFSSVRGLADDVVFERNPSTSRPVDLT